MLLQSKKQTRGHAVWLQIYKIQEQLIVVYPDRNQNSGYLG